MDNWQTLFCATELPTVSYRLSGCAVALLRCFAVAFRAYSLERCRSVTGMHDVDEYVQAQLLLAVRAKLSVPMCDSSHV